MTILKKTLSIIVVALIASVPAIAQDRPTQDPRPSQQPRTGQQPGSVQDPATRGAAQTGAIDSKTNARMVRASKLIGHSLVNSNNENVGSVHDIVMDGQSGKVRYVVVTYGGFLGIGNKLFAVPYEALKYTSQPTTNVLGADRYKHQLVLDVTKEQMEGAVGFDEDNWPDFYDTQFQTDLMKRYRVQHPERYGDDTPEKR